MSHTYTLDVIQNMTHLVFYFSFIWIIFFHMSMVNFALNCALNQLLGMDTDKVKQRWWQVQTFERITPFEVAFHVMWWWVFVVLLLFLWNCVSHMTSKTDFFGDYFVWYMIFQGGDHTHISFPEALKKFYLHLWITHIINFVSPLA